MSTTYSQEKDGLVVVSIDGVLTFDEMQEVQNKQRQQLGQDDKIKVLILAQKFAGWGKGGDWGDLTFMYEADPYIEKIAIVAEEKWEDETLMFTGAGRRQALVEFFLPDEVEQARAWLLEGSE